ncbi:MAG: helix-turn-helix transcriptional regulator [Lachnospiraceae bacterium]|nr:helix-turn-helix transcriptional regulator [Lachnospiraceae bacterium]
MQFNELLNEYISELNISSKELADASGLSPTVISRYRNGNREPGSDSPQLKQLAEGLAKIAAERQRQTGNNPHKLNTDDILAALKQIIDSSDSNTRQTISNLNELINKLKINVSDMSRAINYDASFISRIRTGQRIPQNMDKFIHNVTIYVAKNYSAGEALSSLADVLGLSEDTLTDTTTMQCLIKQWLSTSTRDKLSASAMNFLNELDTFDLDDYMRQIHFDDIMVPVKPFSFPAAKNYYGVKAMKEAELDFLKATVLSRSKKPVYMYSDMPMADMGQDEDFKKKYIMGLGLMIRKGLHINVIHNINRPFEEMMMGLSGYIPLYMTGQISPYYFDRVANPIFSQLNNVSGAAALEGQCVGTHHDDGKYYFTNNRREIEYYRKRALNMIDTALPLMNIYRYEQADEFNKMQSEAVRKSGTYLRISYSLPIYTIPDELLTRMLLRHGINDDERKLLLAGITEHRKRIHELLTNGALQDIIFDIPDDEFDSHPPCLSLSNMFFPRNLTYTKDEYHEHLEAVTSYANQHSNYSFQFSSSYDFRNIAITICHKKWAMVSKNHSPAIHFVIKHPLLRDALEKLVAAQIKSAPP